VKHFFKETTKVTLGLLFIFVVILGCSAWFFSQSSNSKNPEDIIVPREPCGNLKNMPRVYEFYCSEPFDFDVKNDKIREDLCKYLLEYYKMCGEPNCTDTNCIPLDCNPKTDNCGEEDNDR